MIQQQLRVLIAILTFSCGLSAFAQPSASGSVAGTGTASISRVPEIMRVQVAITSKGATLKEALAALKTRSDAARLQVITLGAEKDSVKVDAPRIAAQDPNRRRSMDMMMAQRMKQAGKKGAAKDKTAPPVEVTSTLTAEWKLTAKDPEALLLAVHPLQEKIRSADLAGKAEAEKLSPEQQEMMEELEAAGQNRFSSSEEEPAGTPDFLFVSRVNSAEHEKAMRDAFQSAQVQAGKLAKAAGSELGSLRSITSFDDPSGEYEDYGRRGGYGQSAYRLMQQAARRRATGDAPLEAVGVEPSLVKYSVSLTVAFDLKSGK
jgi:uncharacterized protein YggE